MMGSDGAAARSRPDRLEATRVGKRDGDQDGLERDAFYQSQRLPDLSRFP